MLEQEMVVSVRIYRPIKNHPRQPISSFRYSQEIVLLGNFEFICILKAMVLQPCYDFLEGGRA